MKKIHVCLRCLVGLLAASLWCVAAAGTPVVDARMTVVRIEAVGAQETPGVATAARPGDVLEYAAQYANRGDAPAQDVRPVMPIPNGTEYVPTAAFLQPTHASVDGVRFAPVPLRRTEKTPAGTRVVDVPFAEYRALRWTTGPLAAGKTLTVRARVRVAPPLVAGS